MENIKGSIVKAKRGSFTNDKTGELISYCKFYALVLGVHNDNEYGYDYEPFTCKVEHYSKLLDIIKSNKNVVITVEFVKQSDGKFRRVAKSLDDYVLD